MLQAAQNRCSTILNYKRSPKSPSGACASLTDLAVRRSSLINVVWLIVCPIIKRRKLLIVLSRPHSTRFSENSDNVNTCRNEKAGRKYTGRFEFHINFHFLVVKFQVTSISPVSAGLRTLVHDMIICHSLAILRKI